MHNSWLQSLLMKPWLLSPTHRCAKDIAIETVCMSVRMYVRPSVSMSVSGCFTVYTGPIASHFSANLSMPLNLKMPKSIPIWIEFQILWRHSHFQFLCFLTGWQLVVQISGFHYHEPCYSDEILQSRIFLLLMCYQFLCHNVNHYC